MLCQYEINWDTENSACGIYCVRVFCVLLELCRRLIWVIWQDIYDAMCVNLFKRGTIETCDIN